MSITTNTIYPRSIQLTPAKTHLTGNHLISGKLFSIMKPQQTEVSHMNIIEVNNLTKTYGTLTAVDHISFTVEQLYRDFCK